MAGGTTRVAEVSVRLAAGDRVTVDLPRAYCTGWGEDAVVPWYVRLGDAVSLHGERAALVQLRDALSAALDAHPDDRPRQAECEQQATQAGPVAGSTGEAA